MSWSAMTQHFWAVAGLVRLELQQIHRQTETNPEQTQSVFEHGLAVPPVFECLVITCGYLWYSILPTEASHMLTCCALWGAKIWWGFLVYVAKASCQAWLKLLIASEERFWGSSPTNSGGLGGRFWGRCTRWQLGDGGLRFPPGPSIDVHWGATGMAGKMKQERSQNIRKAMEELEKIGVRLSKGARRGRLQMGADAWWWGECKEYSVRTCKVWSDRV